MVGKIAVFFFLKWGQKAFPGVLSIKLMGKLKIGHIAGVVRDLWKLFA